MIIIYTYIILYYAFNSTRKKIRLDEQKEPSLGVPIPIYIIMMRLTQPRIKHIIVITTNITILTQRALFT